WGRRAARLRRPRHPAAGAHVDARRRPGAGRRARRRGDRRAGDRGRPGRRRRVRRRHGRTSPGLGREAGRQSPRRALMRLAYADPPYPGMAGYYVHHPDYGGEIDHAALLDELDGVDGWGLHTPSTTLRDVLPIVPDDVRLCAWVKPWASFKPGVPIAYAWEPVFI